MRRPVLLLIALVTSPLAAQTPAGMRPPGAPGEGWAPRAWVERVLAVRSLVSETPQWAPGGTRITFLSSLGGGGTSIWGVSPEGGFPTRFAADLGTGGLFLPAPQMHTWSPDGAWISFVSDKSGSPEIWLWSARDGRQLQLTSLGGQRVNSYAWSPDGKWIALGGNRHGNFDLWKVAVPTGEVHRLTTDTRLEAYPAWTPDGRMLVYVRLDDRWMEHEVLELDLAAPGAAPRLITKDSDFFDYGEGSTFGYPLISPDGQTVLFRSQRSGWINYWAVPLAGGSPRPIAPEPAEQSEARWSPDGKQIAYVSNRNGTHDLRMVSAAGGVSRVAAAPPGTGVIANPAWSPDGRRLSYTMATPTRSADLYIVPVEGGQARQLTYSAPGGNIEQQLVVPEKTAYRSDTLTINAYLYKPPVIGPTDRFPAIVLAHGGPTAQFSDTYQQQAQFFARQGYVVLLPNVRGSSGYGRAFEMANNGCWGHCDLRDVVAGVDYLKKLPYVNAAKMGIAGSSYGGHMSTSAITWAPGVFQAAIPASAYPDRVGFMKEGEYRHIQQLAYEFGPFEQNEDVYRRNSPFYWIKDIQTPTFLVWGEGHFPESPQMLQFAKEMERLYKVVRYKAYPNENFYVTSVANTRQMLLDMLDFFNQHLNDKVVTPGGAASLSGR
ncbi:MAG: S9 family peptidase [Gemmatimonadetes bacterium]|nr:S9 family peptidase [Gemmatimonadota bacterium]